ncbi:hypothetical protein COL516b_008319 [Colletotrichum fioriniae]|nr:uncharacterized protein COL516b_008319 [Colletotrichum fioriniae]KAJ0300748.1 hypothetical protein COL516b_008319 [Colletotrichum fioriniae]
MSVSDVSSQALVVAPPSSSSPSPRESSFRTDQPAQTPTRQPAATGTETPDFAPSSSVKTEVSNPDSERHPKGKRKRTAAKDKSILEAAYVANPKPDKAARLDIVKRVSLNEKEVQNDRRKSRPLSAQEIAALRYGGMQILSSDPVAYTSSLPEEKTSPVVETAPVNAVMPAETPVKAIRLRGDETDEQPQQATPSILSGGPEATASETPLSQVTASSSQPHSTGSFSFSNSVGFFTSSHWNPSSAFSTPSTLNRSVDETPNALPSVTLPPITALTDSLPPALGRGRSRDAHAWELCCDADSRDELTTQAEDESNGSAVAAISLLRSTSGVLQNNSSKRNCPASRPASRPQQAKKPKLCRTSSSMARMQTALADDEESVSQPSEEKSLGDKVKVDMLISPSGDSDKENWGPEDEGNMRRLPPINDRRPLPAIIDAKNNARRTGRTLQDHPGPAIFSSSRARTMPAMGRRGSGKYVTIFEDGQSSSSPTPKGADEVESFMRGADVSPSKKGDMDCIAGLLSLSQGAWR